VTGYDVPRLLVGSFGTLGVLTRVIVRSSPRPRVSRWFRTDRDPAAVRAACLAPSLIAWGPDHTTVLLEGDPADVAAQAGAAGLEPTSDEPAWPSGPHRGRISVAPGRLRELGAALTDRSVDWLAEWGVGTVHVASGTEVGLGEARAAAGAAGGWLLREAGAPGLDGFGTALPNGEVMTRIKAAFDPTGKLAPGRLPFTAKATQRQAS
jgi:FAD/FMN-containing dehydrogenase